jgi:hypothetical protein
MSSHFTITLTWRKLALALLRSELPLWWAILVGRYKSRSGQMWQEFAMISYPLPSVVDFSVKNGQWVC